MKSTLLIKDLTRDSELGAKQMAAVRGGIGDQANGTSQLNALAGLVSSNIANGSIFANSAPVIIQSDTTLDQSAHNDNSSTNAKLAWLYA